MNVETGRRLDKFDDNINKDGITEIIWARIVTTEMRTRMVTRMGTRMVTMIMWTRSVKTTMWTRTMGPIMWTRRIQTERITFNNERSKFKN